MTKILFICTGNICRSPMAEFLFRKMAGERGRAHEFCVASAATSREELGNPVHPGTRAVLDKLGISTQEKRAVQMIKRDYQEYDYLIYMDDYNRRSIMRILGGDPDNKVYGLLDFTGRPGDIADPWYTGDFQKTYEDIREGCEALLDRF